MAWTVWNIETGEPVSCRYSIDAHEHVASGRFAKEKPEPETGRIEVEVAPPPITVPRPQIERIAQCAGCGGWTTEDELTTHWNGFVIARLHAKCWTRWQKGDKALETPFLDMVD